MNDPARMSQTPHDFEPQPGDGPDYHAERAAWVTRQNKRSAPRRNERQPMNSPAIPDAAVGAAAETFGHITGTHSRQAAEAILEAAMPHMLSHEREQTRLAHLDAVVNAQTAARLHVELSEARAKMSQTPDDDEMGEK